MNPCPCGYYSVFIRVKSLKIGKLHIWEPRPLEEQILEVLDMQEISTDVAKKIKMSREAELNMERCAEFMARMIQKYGKKILDDIAAESNEQPEQPKQVE